PAVAPFRKERRERAGFGTCILLLRAHEGLRNGYGDYKLTKVKLRALKLLKSLIYRLLVLLRLVASEGVAEELFHGATAAYRVAGEQFARLARIRKLGLIDALYVCLGVDRDVILGCLSLALGALLVDRRPNLHVLRLTE